MVCFRPSQTTEVEYRNCKVGSDPITRKFFCDSLNDGLLIIAPVTNRSGLQINFPEILEASIDGGSSWYETNFVVLDATDVVLVRSSEAESFDIFSFQR